MKFSNKCWAQMEMRGACHRRLITRVCDTRARREKAFNK